MSELPDLRGLETIEIPHSGTFYEALFQKRKTSREVIDAMLRSQRGLTYVPLMLSVILLVPAFIYEGSTIIGYAEAVAAAVAGISLLLLSAVSARTIFYWKADPDGITAISLLRRWYLRWADIDEAVTTDNWVFKLSSGRKKLNVPISDEPYDMLSVAIFQHLRRYRKADLLQLPLATHTFWQPIPNQIPRNLEWNNPQQKSSKPRWYIFTSAFLLAAMIWTIISSHRWHWINILLVVSFLLSMYNSRTTFEDRTATRVAVDDDHISLDTPRGSVTIPWSELFLVRLTSRDDIEIEYPEGKGIAIPLIQGPEGNADLFLAIIRRLRELEKPIYIPIPESLAQDIRI